MCVCVSFIRQLICPFCEASRRADANYSGQCCSDGRVFAGNKIKTMETKQPSSQDCISDAGQVLLSKERRNCPYIILFRL